MEALSRKPIAPTSSTRRAWQLVNSRCTGAWGFQLKPGMTVRADIKAGERTLLTYLFARVMPVRLEGMRIL